MPDVALRSPRVLTGLAVLVVSLLIAGIVLARHATGHGVVVPSGGGVPEAADLVVPGPLTTGLEERIGRLDGVDLVYGRTHAVTRGITVSSDPGSGPFATTVLHRGRYPLGPGQIAVTPGTAARLGLRIGSIIQGTALGGAAPGGAAPGGAALGGTTSGGASLKASSVGGASLEGAPLGDTSLTVVGTVTGREDAALQAYAPQTTVSALRHDDRIDRVDVLLRPGADPEAVLRRIDTLLGPHAPAISRRRV